MARGMLISIGTSRDRRRKVSEGLPLSPLFYEFGNSLISSLAVCLTIIFARFFATEVMQHGLVATYRRARVKFALGVCAMVGGEGGFRMWTWWGRYCANNDIECAWMLRRAWPFVPAISMAVQLVGMLCMIRMLVPEVWGRYAWVISATLSVSWSLFWFSGWSQILRFLP